MNTAVLIAISICATVFVVLLTLCILYVTVEVSSIRNILLRLTSIEQYLSQESMASHDMEDSTPSIAVATDSTTGKPISLNDVLFRLLHDPSSVTPEQRSNVQSLLSEFLDRLSEDTRPFDFDQDD